MAAKRPPYGYLAHKKTLTLGGGAFSYGRGTPVQGVLGGWASSYGRGTPVQDKDGRHVAVFGPEMDGGGARFCDRV